MLKEGVGENVLGDSGGRSQVKEMKRAMHTSAPRLYNNKRSRIQRREALIARAAQPPHSAAVPCVE